MIFGVLNPQKIWHR